MPAQNPPAARISVGRDVTGQIVVGDGNLVLTSPAATTANPSPCPSPPLEQQNTVKGHGTAYSAAQGDIHIHHHTGVAVHDDAADASETHTPRSAT